MADYPSTIATFPTWVNGDDIDASNQNAPNDEITAIETGMLDGFSHNLQAPGFRFDNAASLTIASGVVTITQGYNEIDTEGAAATDDLDTITIGVMSSGVAIGEGSVIVLQSANSARTVVVKTGTGNITLGYGNCSLATTSQRLVLIYSGSAWVELARSGATMTSLPAGAVTASTIGVPQATGYIYLNSPTNTSYILGAATGMNLAIAGGQVANLYTSSSGTPSEIPSVYSSTSGAAANVVVAAGGVLARSTSSLRYKTDVQPFAGGLSDLLQLQPITFAEKQDPDGPRFLGLTAEAMDAAGFTNVVVYDEQGRPDAIQYDRLTMYLINAIKELSADVDTLKRRQKLDVSHVTSAPDTESKVRAIRKVQALVRDHGDRTT